jgi:hypothetical protein
MLGRFKFQMLNHNNSLKKIKWKNIDNFFCWIKEHVEPCYKVLWKTMWSRKTCARRQEKHARTKLEGGYLSSHQFSCSCQITFCYTCFAIQNQISKPAPFHHWEDTNHQHDETLPIINKPKHPKKRGFQRIKWTDPRPRRQKNHLRCGTTRGNIKTMYDNINTDKKQCCFIAYK